MTPRFLPFAALLLFSLPLGCDQGGLGPGGGPEPGADPATGALLVEADLENGLHELVDDTGAALDLARGHALTLRYAGPPGALVTSLCTPDGSRLDVEDGDPIVISDGVSLVHGTFRSSWTLEEFALAIENTLNLALGTETDTHVEILDEGTLRFSNPPGGKQRDITVSVHSPQRTVFNSMIDGIPVPEEGAGRSRATRVVAEVVRDPEEATVEDLRDGLQAAFEVGSPDVEVRYAAGRLVVDNPPRSSQDLHGVWLETPSHPGALDNLIGFWGVSLRRGETFSMRGKLLVRAVAAKPLVDVLDREGNRTSLAPGDEIVFSAGVNGQPIDPVSLVVSSAGDGSSADCLVWTIEGLLQEIAGILPLRADGGATLEDGRVLLRAEEGVLISNPTTAVEAAPAFEEVFRFTVE